MGHRKRELRSFEQLSSISAAPDRHGLVHVPLMNVSAAVGVPPEAETRTPGFAELPPRLAEL